MHKSFSLNSQVTLIPSHIGGVRFQSMGGLKKFLSTRMFMSKKLQAPKARSCDCRRKEAPTTRGSGERRKLPQRGLGRSPRNRRDFEQFSCKMEYILGSC